MANINSPKINLSRFNPILTVLYVLSNMFWLVLLIALVLRIFVFQQVQVDGKSMFPNYDDKQYLLVNQIDKNFQRGQVVAAYAYRNFADEVTHRMNPINSYFARFSCDNPAGRTEADCKAKFYLKRIVGLSGEEIEIIGGTVIIYNSQYPDGKILEESYISDSVKKTEESRNFYLPRTKIPAGDFFLMGDNRSNSYDSRAIGTFADFAIFGKETFRVYPFDTFHNFDLPEYTFSDIPNSLRFKIPKVSGVINATFN
jgi:signal peptidase I